MGESAEYRTVVRGGSAEITEKRSRFIAAAAPARSEEEARAFLAGIRKQYPDARHHCFAYVLRASGELQKCSDDGEPSGTAGRPILQVLLGEDLKDTILVVTRYFGGILLGTGGLIRAYTQAAKAGLAAAGTAILRPGVRLQITTDYTGLGKIQYILGQHGIPVQEPVYTDNVQLGVVLPVSEEAQILGEITEATGGRAKITWQGDCWFEENSYG